MSYPLFSRAAKSSLKRYPHLFRRSRVAALSNFSTSTVEHQSNVTNQPPQWSIQDSPEMNMTLDAENEQYIARKRAASEKSAHDMKIRILDSALHHVKKDGLV